MFATGVAISSPCEMAIRRNEPMSNDCLQYLYRNQGAGTSIGATYTLGSQHASANGQYNTPEGRLNPVSPTAAARALATGTVTGVKQLYDTANRTSNNNALRNEQRTEAIRDSYGDKILQSEAEVYMVGPSYIHLRKEAAGVCARYGGRVATKAEAQNAFRAGANWCFTGWVSDQEGAVYPINEQLVQGCAPSPMLAEWTPPKEWTPPEQRAGVTCFGPKPARNTVTGGTILPFNTVKDIWNQKDIV
jgi:hypothetical protein